MNATTATEAHAAIVDEREQSGIGREGGVHSMEFYTGLRNVCIKL